MVMSGHWPKVEQPMWTIRTPPCVPDGLPALVESIAKAQEILAARARAMDVGTEHYRAVLATMHALVQLASIWTKVAVVTSSEDS